MNVDIEKIDNGYVVNVAGKKTFCSTPESICGLLAEWALKHCEALEAKQDDASAKMQKALGQLAGGAAVAQAMYMDDPSYIPQLARLTSK